MHIVEAAQADSPPAQAGEDSLDFSRLTIVGMLQIFPPVGVLWHNVSPPPFR